MQQDMQEKIFEAINDLTKKGAQQAQDMEAQNIECDDPHEKVRAPMVEVESYPRLIEAIPSLETDFFRSPIPEEERKEIIYEAIGATIAARAGISTDAILTQANWSSYYMFSSYYKLSNDSYSNITESVFSELT
ncbi:hypothetical protein BB561_006518 [Smittium simulii]|uniref:Uncharacterized protein n=1 Tax=Smittium simulii TaxID=133385 RepID=A0A2T9Y3I1_9FUNG|nr:hypothetical protein BB561_006518 [Smittium simulii]